MKYTKDELINMGFSEKFINMMGNIVEEDGYKYQVVISATSKSLYAIDDEEKLIKTHIEHISEDYLIEDKLEVVISNGYLTNLDGVVAEFLFRKKITALEKMGVTIRYADENLIKEKFGNIQIDSQKVYRLATYKIDLEHHNYYTDEKIIEAHMSKVLRELSQSDDFRLVCIKGYVTNQAIAELLIYDIDEGDIK